MTIAIPIPIFEFTEEENKLAELDLGDVGALGFKKLAERFFWSIDSAFVYEGPEGEDFTGFYSGGTSFVTPMKLKEFVKLINDNNVQV